jgi:antitoxin component YwqK of YwqJK toxin-antitoxin module
MMVKPYWSFTDENGNKWTKHDEECGDVVDVYECLNGELHGNFRTDNLSDLSPVLSCTYNYGELHGEHLEWCVDRDIDLISTTYDNGVLHGPIKKWDYDGNLVVEGNYMDGKKHGVFKTYNEIGDVELYEEYYNDVLVTPCHNSHNRVLAGA